MRCLSDSHQQTPVSFSLILLTYVSCGWVEYLRVENITGSDQICLFHKNADSWNGISLVELEGCKIFDRLLIWYLRVLFGNNLYKPDVGVYIQISKIILRETY